MRFYEDLRPYQKWMVEKALSIKKVALWAQQGLGKTASAFYIMSKSIERGETSKWLVVAPLLVAQTTWPDELKEWLDINNIKLSVVVGSEAKRIKALESNANVFVINRENLIWLYKHYKGKFPFDGLVYDESSRLKSGKSLTLPDYALEKNKIFDLKKKISEHKHDPFADVFDPEVYEILWPKPIDLSYVKSLEDEIKKVRSSMKPRITEFGVVCKMMPFLKSIVQLTGTPTPQGLVDLWGQIYILDGGERLHTSKNQFLSRWFDKNPYNFKITPKSNALKEITDLVSDIAFSLRSDDYLSLPDVVNVVVKVKLSEDVMLQYKKFKKEFVLEEYDIEAVNSGVLTCKLLQLSNGSVYKGGEKEIIEIHDEKIKALERIIEESEGQPILVAYEFQFDLLKIKKHFPKAVVLNKEPGVVKKWNEGKIKLLITHPASAAHGLNLQNGGCISVWYGLTWSLELYQQFNKRLHRSGQKNIVTIYHIVSENTFDEVQYKVLNDKGSTQDMVTEKVKALLSEV